MTGFLCSVQTAQDASIPPSLVIAAVLALVVLVIAVTLPSIVREWRKAGRVIDDARRLVTPPTHIPAPRAESRTR